ncbi:peptidase S1 [Actinokineospora xionganensis]|uniref:Peptidase S1 n=1 Tax=Actinokineospora xionganensis TaxID=2684470 RepID=A0ABR7L3Z1_9PSEU|nr:peptidase S1 [Actinokineospora xionganensis]MBC6447400.1 peptidase S1 [Actinokineospora xionganensis]
MSRGIRSKPRRAALGLAVVGLTASLLGVAAPTSAAATTVTLGGGSGIAFDQGLPGDVTQATAAGCTLTAVGYDRTGNLVGLTNAHCFIRADGTKLVGEPIYKNIAPAGTAFNAAKVITPDTDTGVVGTVTHVSTPNNLLSDGPDGLDYAVIDLDETKVAPTTTVGGVTITSVGAVPGVGVRMCKQGQTTGLTCGFNLGTSGIWFAHTVWTWAGDSGAPVVVGQTLVGNAWGLQHSSPILSIIADMDANGGVGAGFRVAA